MLSFDWGNDGPFDLTKEIFRPHLLFGTGPSHPGLPETHFVTANPTYRLRHKNDLPGKGESIGNCYCLNELLELIKLP